MDKDKIHIPFHHYFWIFTICSFFGTIYEEIFHIINYLIKYGRVDWSRRSGLFWGPLSPVYGFGAVFLLLTLGRKDRKNIRTYIYASLLGGLAEYVMSYAQEWVTGTNSWNYSEKFLNIGGRTSVIYMLGWGLAGLVLIKWLYPKVRECIAKIPRTFYKLSTAVLVVLIAFDLVVSWTALARMELRHKGIEPYTFIGEFYDDHFDDDYIKKKYPNMEEK